jgi:hypothetical protein
MDLRKAIVDTTQPARALAIKRDAIGMNRIALSSH